MFRFFPGLEIGLTCAGQGWADYEIVPRVGRKRYVILALYDIALSSVSQRDLKILTYETKHTKVWSFCEK